MQNVIIIPCPVGTVVYLKRKYSWQGDTDYILYKITNLTITQNKKGIWTKKYRAMRLVDGKTTDDAVNFNFDDIGHTVFYQPPKEIITWQDMESKALEIFLNSWYNLLVWKIPRLLIIGKRV